MKYIIFIPVIFITAFAALHFNKTEISDNAALQLYTLKENDFTIEIKTIGNLDAARSHMISSDIRGDKGKIIYLINDGEHVKKGDILVKLDPTPFEEEVHRLKAELISLQSAVEAAEQILEWEKSQVVRETRTAEFNLKIARLELKKLTEGDGPLQISQFKEEMEKSAEEYRRYLAYIADLKILQKKGYENTTEIKMAEKKSAELKEKYESANKKYISYTQHVFPSLKETARARVEKAEMELEQTQKGSAFKIAKAITGLNETKKKFDMTEKSLHQAKKELEKTEIKAPFAGISILYEAFRDGQKRKPRVGDRVLKNQPLLYLPDISSMIVKTQIRETDLHKTALEQKCFIRADAYPDILFEGKITFIGIMAAREGRRTGEKYFQLTISLNGEDSRLRPGMTARVSILVEQVKGALSVPVQAVFEEKGSLYCYRFEKNIFRKTFITAGRQNEDMLETLSGLKKGEQVSLLRPSPESVEAKIDTSQENP